MDYESIVKILRTVLKTGGHISVLNTIDIVLEKIKNNEPFECSDHYFTSKPDDISETTDLSRFATAVEPCNESFYWFLWMYQLKFNNLKAVYKTYENGLDNFASLHIDEIWDGNYAYYLEHLCSGRYTEKIKEKQDAELVKICYEACKPFINDVYLIIKLYSTVALHSMLTRRLRVVK